jgi:DNA-binding XRE family transcriptional regulator
MEIIKKWFGIDPRTDPAVQAHEEAFRIAQRIYDARQTAGMTQRQLAEAIGTTEETIVDLEAADYEGDSLSMFRRVADALHLKLCVELVPVDIVK